MEWFRFYNDVRSDNKLRHLSDAEFRVWVNLLCLASEQSGEARGTVPVGDRFVLAAEVANADEELLAATLKKLAALRIVVVEAETVSFAQWSKRQFRSDSSAERVQKHRENRRTAASTTPDSSAVTLHDDEVALPKQPVTPPETDPEADPEDTAPRTRAHEESKPAQPDAFAVAENWITQRLGRVQLSPKEWPVLTEQLAAVSGDVAQYQRVVEAVLAQHPDDPPPGSIRYFNRPFAEARARFRLPDAPPRASPPSEYHQDPSHDEYMAAMMAARGGTPHG